MPLGLRGDLGYSWIPSRNYGTGRRGAAVDLIVIHTAECSESPGKSAEAVARYFATTTRQASAHFCCDDQTVVQCVRLADTAWAAPGANQNGVQIELAGYANQTPEQWDDSFSVSMLKVAASLVSDVATRFNIPLVELDEHDLALNRRGVTTHAAVSRAFRKSTHTDPGVHFPFRWFLELAGAKPCPI